MKDVVANSKKGDRVGFTEQQASKWEHAQTSFTYEQLVDDILPAYKVADFDVFLDFCHHPTVSEVTHVTQFVPDIIGEGAHVTFARPTFLAGHRTRIDIVTLDPNASTTWKAHNGHEFVYVLDGEVVCEFAENLAGERHRQQVPKGTAIAFHSGLFHIFRNNGKKKALLVAARPSCSSSASQVEAHSTESSPVALEEPSPGSTL